MGLVPYLDDKTSTLPEPAPTLLIVRQSSASVCLINHTELEVDLTDSGSASSAGVCLIDHTELEVDL